MQITVSDSAKSKLSELLASRGGTPSVRVGLRSGGCKGFEQYVELSALPMTDDTVIDCGAFQVYIDKKSTILLGAATLDWKKTLTESRFAFIFPQAASPCSCGKSFSL